MNNSFDELLFKISKIFNENNKTLNFLINYYISDNENNLFINTNYVINMVSQNINNSSNRNNVYINFSYVELYELYKKVYKYIGNKNPVNMSIKVNRKYNGYLYFNKNNITNSKEHLLQIKYGDIDETINLNNYELGAFYHTIEYCIDNRNENKFLYLYNQINGLNNRINFITNTMNQNNQDLINNLNKNNDKLINNFINIPSMIPQHVEENNVELNDISKYEMKGCEEEIKNDDDNEIEDIVPNKPLIEENTFDILDIDDNLSEEDNTEENNLEDLNNQLVDYVTDEENQNKIKLKIEKDNIDIFNEFGTYDKFKSEIELCVMKSRPFISFINNFNILNDIENNDINNKLKELFFNEDPIKINKYLIYYSYKMNSEKLNIENNINNTNSIDIAKINNYLYVPLKKQVLSNNPYLNDIFDYLIFYHLLNVVLLKLISSNNDAIYYLFDNIEYDKDKLINELSFEIFKMKYIFGVWFNTIINYQEMNKIKEKLSNFIQNNKSNIYINHNMNKIKIELEKYPDLIDQFMKVLTSMKKKIKDYSEFSYINIFDNVINFVKKYIEKGFSKLDKKDKLLNALDNIYDYRDINLYFSIDELMDFDIELLKLLMLINNNNFEKDENELMRSYKLLLESNLSIKDIIFKIKFIENKKDQDIFITSMNKVIEQNI